MSLYVEDLEPGMSWRTASATLSADDIVDFATQWDPQPFHIDRTAGEASFFGGLVASGLHTFVLTFRLYNDLGLFRDTAVAGVGVENMRWLRPVKEGTTLRASATVHAVEPSRRPGLGRVTMRLQSFDEEDVRLFTFDLTILLKRRPAEEAAAPT